VLPKALIPLDDMPILQIILLQLRKAGVTQITLAVCYKAQQIIRYFGDGRWLDLDIEYTVEPKLFGTAGPLRLIESFTEPSLVINADILTTIDFADVYAAFHQSRAAAMIVLHKHTIPVPYGVVETDEHGYIQSIVEKPEYACMINTGIYVIDPLVRTYLLSEGYEDMPDLLRTLLDRGHKVSSYIFCGDWIDIGTPEQFQRAQEMFRRNRERYAPHIDRSTLMDQGIEISRLGSESASRLSLYASKTTATLW
jgi:NDP-sugar pyrophosphorylase family protein